MINIKMLPKKIIDLENQLKELRQPIVKIGVEIEALQKKQAMLKEKLNPEIDVLEVQIIRHRAFAR